MSYAGPVQGRSTRRPTSMRPSTAEADEAMEWKHVAIFGAGLALGITLGAGVALLTAPQSGAETRAGFVAGPRTARGAVRGASTDAWHGVQAEMRRIARALRRRKAQRAAEQSLQADSTELP
jgi:Predicted symporter